MTKQVQPVPFSSREPTRVFLGCVESVTKVWVLREDDEERLNDLNAKLSQAKKGRKQLYQYLNNRMLPSKKFRFDAVSQVASWGCVWMQLL